MPSNLELAVNAALSQRQAAFARYAAANPFSMGIDAKRDAAWSEYGFKEEITYDDLYKLYRRGKDWPGYGWLAETATRPRAVILCVCTAS